MLRPSLALSAVVLVLLVAPSSGNGGPDAAHPVTVGSTRLAAGTMADLERRIEAAWLRDEARASGLRSGEGLRARVARALAAAGARGIPGAFNRFHERHRATTRCLAGATDPYADRCIDQPPAPQGSCRWMGEATLCRVEAVDRRRVWLVLHGSDGPRRHRRHANAVAALRRIYLRAREHRARAARAERAERAFRRAAAEHRLALAQAEASRRRFAAVRRARLQRRREARRTRLADPRLSDASLPRARRACLRYRRDSEPYVFGLGTQDPAGQVSGLLAVRAALGRRLAHAAVDQIDRRKLSGLLGALRDGDGPLRRLRAVRELDDVLAARARYARVGRRAGRLATRLGLPDCAR